MTTQESTQPIWTEAPASWNSRYITPDGFTCQLTLRANSGKGLLEKSQSALAYLREQGCIPFYGYSKSNDTKPDNTDGDSTPDESDPAWCPIHKVYMTKREKNGKVWYSHKVDGKWCNNGKGKKE